MTPIKDSNNGVVDKKIRPSSFPLPPLTLPQTFGVQIATGKEIFVSLMTHVI